MREHFRDGHFVHDDPLRGILQVRGLVFRPDADVRIRQVQFATKFLDRFHGAHLKESHRGFVAQDASLQEALRRVFEISDQLPHSDVAVDQMVA